MQLNSITFPGLGESYQLPFAPGGYGLGVSPESENFKTISTISDLDSVTKNGFYAFRCNSNITISGFTLDFFAVRVWAFNDNNVIQEIFPSGWDYVLRRARKNGTWGELEWFNPPMLLGVEYRTTERFEGKPVYTKVINCGKATPGGTTSISLNGDFGTMVIRSEAHNKWMSMPYYIGNDTYKLVAKAVTPTEIEIEAGTSHTNTTICVRAWYLK